MKTSLFLVRKALRGGFLGFVVILLLLLVSPIQLATAAPLAAPAVDGDGQVTVSPTNVAYGSGTGTFTFTFSTTSDFVLGSQVAITIPSGWTAPTTAAGAGHVSWFVGTCTLSGSPPVGITGMTIFIDIASCPAGSSFTITYANVTSGPVSLAPYTFQAQTDIGPGGQGLVNTNAPSPTVSVDPKTITVTGITANSKVYDGTTSATLNFGSAALVGVLPADSGNVSLDSSAYSASFNTKHVGTGKAVAVSSLGLTGSAAGNYVLTQPTTTGSITKRPVTVTAVTDTKTYDGTTSSSGAPTLSAGILAPGDTVTWTQTFNTKHVGAGNKVLTPAGMVNDGNGGNDYSYTYTSVSTGTINKRPITIVAETDTKTYDGTTTSTGVPLLFSGSIAPGDTAPTWTQTFDNKNVGANKVLTPAGVVSDGNGGNNYSYTYTQDTTGVVNPKPLTVSGAGLTPSNKVYDGTTNATLTPGSPSLVGVVSPDVVTLLGVGTATGTFADKNAGVGKTVNISGLTLGGAGAGNYTLTQPTRTANITKKPITVTAVTDTKIYDGTTSSSGVPVLSPSTPLAAGDSAPIWTQTFNNKNAGTGKVLTPAGLVNDGNGGNNYAYTYAAVSTGVISKLSITVTAVSDSKAYDGLVTSSGIPLLSPATPLAPGDTEPVWSQTFANKNVGTGKTITPSGLVNDTNGGNNYSYNFVPNVSGVITARAITVSAVPDTAKIYDGTTSSSVAPSITPDLVGTDTSAFIQTFDTPDAGTGKVLTPSGTVNDGNGGNNYSITFDPTVITGTINKATPTLSVTNSPVMYNGLPQSAIVVASVTGTVSNIQYNDSATAPTNAGTYAVTADFASGNPNYNDLTGASAGKFVIRKERTLNGGLNTYVGASKVPKSWVASNFAAADGKDTFVKQEGTASVKIAGLAGATKTLTQTLNFSGASGDLLTFSFWMKGTSIPTAGLCRAQVFLYNGTTLNATKTLVCANGTYNFRKKSQSFFANASYTKVVIVFTYAKNSGTIWFDGVSLIK
jgi:plastocyanin